MSDKASTIILSFILLAFFSCQSKVIENKGVQKKQKEDPLSFAAAEKQMIEEREAEFYNVDNKAVIFFMPTIKEQQKMFREFGSSYKWETTSMFNNFKKQSRDFKKLIKKQNIKTELVHSSKIKINLDNGNSVYFDRIKEDQIMGQILTDGVQEPNITYGKFKNKELAKLIKDFFGIEDLGKIPSDSTKKEMKKGDKTIEEGPFEN